MEDEKNRRTALIAQHAILLNEGFPQDETQKFWQTVSALPEAQQAEIRRLCELARLVKRSADVPSR